MEAEFSLCRRESFLAFQEALHALATGPVGACPLAERVQEFVIANQQYLYLTEYRGGTVEEDLKALSGRIREKAPDLAEGLQLIAMDLSDEGTPEGAERGSSGVNAEEVYLDFVEENWPGLRIEILTRKINRGRVALKELELSVDETIAFAIEHQLTNVNLTGLQIDDAGLEKIVTGCKQLTTLTLCWNDGITDAGITQIVASCTQLTSLTLWLGGGQVTDRGVMLVARHCTQLTSFALWGRDQITDAGVEHLAQGCKKLTSLILGGCNRITDFGLGHIASQCTQLGSLDLRGCRGITDNGITQIVAGCEQLRSLNLSGCNISDAGLREIADHCQQLTSIDLCYCSKITDAGVEYLVERCRLTTLKLWQCNISSACLERIKRTPSIINMIYNGHEPLWSPSSFDLG